jgi:predicted RNase H-like HicB family nuclease
MTSKRPTGRKSNPPRSDETVSSHSPGTFVSPAISAPPGPDPFPPAGGRAVSAQPITIEVKVRLQAIALPEAEGGYSVVVPALPGCYTEGDTIEEVQANIVEAAEGWLAATHDRRREQAVRDMAE